MSTENFKLIAEEENPSGVGARLRGARLKSGRTLVDISNELKIRQEHLTAIEKELFEDLPGGAYTVGFIKSYAEAVGDNGDEVVRILKEYQKVTTDVRLPQFEKVETDVLPSKKTLMILFIFILISVFSWWLYTSYFKSFSFPSKEDVLKEDVAVLESEKPLSENAQESSIKNLEEKQSLSEEDKAVEDILFKMSQKKKEESAIHQPLDVILKAEDDVWISVYRLEDKANPVLNAVLKKGETYSIPKGENMRMNVGRPHVLSLRIGGKDYPVVGPEWGGVIKELPLDSRYLIETFYGQKVNEESYSRWLKKNA